MDIDLSQKLFCPRGYRTVFQFRASTNSNTAYHYFSNGVFTTIRGTVGGIAIVDGISYTALSTGVADVKTESGLEATIVGGQMTAGTKDSLTVYPAPKPEGVAVFTGSVVKILTHPTNRILFDGEPTIKGFQPKTVKIEALSGEFSYYTLRQWPKQVFTFEKISSGNGKL